MIRYAIVVALVATVAADPAPRLSVKAIEPAKGDVDGGTYCRITGSRFIADGPRSAKVYFGSRQGTIVRFASDTELDEQRKAVVVDAFANEVGAIELEDQQKRHIEAAAGRERVPGGCRACTSQSSRGHRGDTVSRARCRSACLEER